MYNKNKQLGMSVGLICSETIPTKWMLHMQNAAKSFPGGLYWSYVVSVNDFSKTTANYATARTDVVKQALTQGTKYLLFIDSDVFIPMDAVTRMMSHDKDIVTGVYWMKTQPPQPVIYEEVGAGPIWNIEPREELMEIGGAGLGCCLIKMDVFREMEKKGIPWFKQDFVEERQGRTVSVNVGEDHWFFERVRDMGYKVWCDTNILCDHLDVNSGIFYPGEDTVRKISKKVLEKKGDFSIIEHQDSSRNLDPKKPTMVMYNANSVPFDGSSISKKPIAGSETAVISMARELKSISWNMHVCCNAEEEGLFDGVSYHHYSKINDVTDNIVKNVGKISVFVSSRDLRPFLGGRPPAEKTVLWVHDMPCESMKQLPQAIENIDLVFFVSQYQADEYQKAYGNCLPQDKIYITRNGVDTKRFDKNIQKVSGNCIYATTPFRGLDVLLGMWPRIKEQVPNATLDVYSGMSIYNMQEYPETQKIFDYGKRIADRYDIRFHEPVTQDKLAEEMMKASVVLYPSTFNETSCIYAMEAISAGIPMITSLHSALRETIKDGEGVFIEGDPYSDEYQEKFIKAVVQEIKDSKPRKSPRDLSWIKVAKEWTDKLTANQIAHTKGKGHQEADEAFEHFNAKKTSDGVNNINNKEFWDERSKYLVSKEKEHTKLPVGDAERHRVLGDMLPKNGAIMDAGCSTGSFLEYLKDAGIGKKLIGFDISQVALSAAQEKVPDAELFICDESPEEMPVKDVDVIVCMHTVEHLDKPENYLNEWKKSLKEGGRVILVVPLQDDDYFEHLKIYDISGVDELVKKLKPKDYNISTRDQGWIYKNGRKAKEAIAEITF